MEYVVFRRFTEEADKNELISTLETAGIDYEVTQSGSSLEVLVGDRQLQREYIVKIKPGDFEQSNQLLSEKNRHDLDKVNPEHYLFDFSDDELFDVLVKPDEWSDFDYQLASKILHDRGRDVSEYTLEQLRKQRIKELAKTEEPQTSWILMGYVMACLGGLIGIFIGLHLATFKKTLPNGKRLYAFREKDRSHGWRIIMIGVVMLLIVSWIRAAPYFSE